MGNSGSLEDLWQPSHFLFHQSQANTPARTAVLHALWLRVEKLIEFLSSNVKSPRLDFSRCDAEFCVLSSTITLRLFIHIHWRCQLAGRHISNAAVCILLWGLMWVRAQQIMWMSNAENLNYCRFCKYADWMTLSIFITISLYCVYISTYLSTMSASI